MNVFRVEGERFSQRPEWLFTMARNDFHRLSGAGHHTGTMNPPREDQSAGQESVHAETTGGHAPPIRTTSGLPADRAKLRDRGEHGVQVLAAKLALTQLHRELMDLNPSAARSLEEGLLKETLTVHRLQMPPQLRKTLASTNVIESAFSIVERVCCNVKRWHGGDQRERWVGSGLLVAEKQIPPHSRIQANAHSSQRIGSARSSKPEVVKRPRAS